MRLFVVELIVNGTVTESDVAAQRAFLADLTASGRLLLSGGLPQRPGRGLAILRADATGEAREIYSKAPVVAAGLATFELLELLVTGGTAAVSDGATRA